MSASAIKIDEMAEDQDNDFVPPKQEKKAPNHMYGTIGAKIGWRDCGGEKGRGVFALEDIPKGTIIEVGPVIPVAADAIPEEGGAPDGYLLDWDPDEEGEEHCMVCGYIMMTNHSKNPTMYLENNYEEMTVTSYAIRDIKAGEELTWDYSCDIWFDEEEG
ncbi:MAG: SET domain-containing protein-lysine N-methyltransferase [Alphaproteobacteria bacterium]|nr:SET domain-containing protein-lysine N-methyltransferase [Alphaproteobacteria bacterium]